MPVRPIADDLFTWQDDEPSLIGSRCEACGTYTFPLRTGCPQCGATSMRKCHLAPTVDAAARAYELAGVSPAEVGIAQLQDTDAGAEVMHMAECGLCKDGEQNELIASGATALSGRLPVNTDGGLIANGEPVGASGLRQVHELVTQLRGRAGQRQVANTPNVALAQLYGARASRQSRS